MCGFLLIYHSVTLADQRQENAAAKRRKNTAHGASRGKVGELQKAPKGRKKKSLMDFVGLSCNNHSPKPRQS
jgi:hypothetical protein